MEAIGAVPYAAAAAVVSGEPVRAPEHRLPAGIGQTHAPAVPLETSLQLSPLPPCEFPRCQSDDLPLGRLILLPFSSFVPIRHLDNLNEKYSTLSLS